MELLTADICWRRITGAESTETTQHAAKVPPWNHNSTLRIEDQLHTYAILVPGWNSSPQAYAGAANQHWLSETHASTDECSTMEPRQHVVHRAWLANGHNVVPRWNLAADP